MSQPLRILLIDDNPHDRILLGHELKREFPDLFLQEVLDATGFEQALEAGEFDLVVTDYQLRWINGILVLQALKSRYPYLPVIMFTGTGNEEIAVEAMKAGLDDYIIKAPLRYFRVSVAVKLALERAETRKRAARLEAERERLLVQERAAREEAEKANRIKDEFLAVLSHELRSPLNPILGWSQLLRRSKYDEATLAKGLETIERNVKLQIQLIDDLLDVSRILRGKLLLNIAPVNLVATVAAAIETVRLAARTKSIQIQTITDPNDCRVLGDEARLQQIVWNLLSNAVKFTPSGGKIEVRVDLVDTTAQLQVKDTGQGISPDFLPYVFDYFRQADSSTTRQFGGLGLGLALVRHLVELHGGTALAESPGVGQGATFTVRLPLLTSQSESLPESPSLDRALDLSGLKILVVDDDPSTREFLIFALEQYGAIVSTASSALEALSALTQSPFDILLSDIGMPEIDGYNLIRKVRSSLPDMKKQILAIALTAYAQESDRQFALEAGFQGHIAKPVNLIELVTLVARLVER